MSREVYHVGDHVLISDAMGASSWGGVVVETASKGTRLKVRPMKRQSFWHKPGANWITAWSRVELIDDQEARP